MLNGIIILLLGIAIYSGARRGLALQLVYTLGYFISFVVAKAKYQTLAPKLELYIPYPSATQNSKMVFFDHATSFELDKAFYGAVAFLGILFIGWLITRFVGMLCQGLTYLPLIHTVNVVGGGLLSFVVVLVGIFLVLRLASLVPVDLIQNQFKASSLARNIVEKTPIFSKQIYELWVTQMLH